MKTRTVNVVARIIVESSCVFEVEAECAAAFNSKRECFLQRTRCTTVVPQRENVRLTSVMILRREIVDPVGVTPQHHKCVRHLLRSFLKCTMFHFQQPVEGPDDGMFHRGCIR